MMRIVRRRSGVDFRPVQVLQGKLNPMSRAVAEVLEHRLCLSAVNVLTAFDGETDGFTSAGVIVSGGMMYGVTPIGGDNNAEGGVYSVPLAGGNPDLIAGFSGSNGSGPIGDLLLVDGTLYGVTDVGGASNDGVVFSLPITGGTPTVLATFNGANGAGPQAGLIVSNDILYGTTDLGGANNMGEVFSLPITGGTVSVLASFSGTDGKNPEGPLTLQNGILYGNTRVGGGFNEGTIYSVPITGGSPTVLADMSPTVGEVPEGPMVLLNNTLYGAASSGGSLGRGTIFSVNISGGTPTVLFNFDNAHGAIPAGGLTIANGILYGTTAEGGASNLGEVFGMLPTASTPTVIASFDATTGTLPFSTPAISNGLIYGATLQGATSNAGSLWSVAATSGSALQFDVSINSGSTNTALSTIFVSVVRPDGSVDNSDTGPITLSIASGPTGANLSGTITTTPSGGLATFSNVLLDTAGTYTLQATDILDTSATSSSFTVQLSDTFTFTTQPTTGEVDKTLSPIVVQAVTNQGVPDKNYNGPVTVGVSQDAVGGFLTGTTTVNASNGVATFSDLSTTVAGIYQMSAGTPSSLPASFSNTFQVENNPTELIATVALSKFPLPGTSGLDSESLLPGGKATATLTLNNATGSLATGVLHVDLYLTSVDDLGFGSGPADLLDGQQLTTPALNHLTLNIPAGKIKSYNATFIVPSLPDERGELLVASLTTVSGLSLPTAPTPPVESDGLYPDVIEFGNVGRPGVKLLETIGDVPVHFSLSGPGNGTLSEDNNGNWFLQLTGTTTASSISMTAATAFTLASITAQSAVGAINAPQLNVDGTITLPGARQIRMGNLTGSTFTLGGSTPANLSLGDVSDSAIVATSPIRALTINSFTSTGIAKSIQAASIASFTDKGAFTGNLATTGNLGPVLIRGNLTGDILAGTNLGTDNEPGGNDDTFGPATLSSVHVVGNVSASIIAAGLKVLNDKFLPANFVGIGGSKIGAVRVDGTLGTDSLVLSVVLPAKAIIGGQRLTTANDNRFNVLPEA